MPKKKAKSTTDEWNPLFELLTGLSRAGIEGRTLAGIQQSPDFDIMSVPDEAWNPATGIPNIGAYSELNLPSTHGTSLDLPMHALASQKMAERWGAIPSLIAGVAQEVPTGARELMAGRPVFSSKGVSTSDLLANMIGVGRGSPSFNAFMDLFAGEGGDVEGSLKKTIEALLQTEETRPKKKKGGPKVYSKKKIPETLGDYISEFFNMIQGEK